MAEIYTFSESGMRELVAAFRQQKNEVSNLRRHLQRVQSQRVVYMPPGGGVKLLQASQVLYAAFGGGASSGNAIDYANAESNALAISTGNYVPLSSGSLATYNRRLLYPRRCYVWELDSDNVLSNTLEEVYCVNPGGLPIAQFSFFSAVKLEGSTYYIPVQKPSDICGDAKIFASYPSLTLDGDGTPKIVRADWQPDVEPPTGGIDGNATTDFAHTEDYDVFIHHPGVYEITFGMEVVRTSSDSSDDKQWTDSNADTIDLPTTMHFTGELFRNYDPASGNITAQFDTFEQVAASIGPGDSRIVTVERTVMVIHTLDTWHGQPYMRLSFAAKCNGGGPDAALGEGRLNACWIRIRPGGGGGVSEGSGYNVFLGASGAFQWWGGGSAPGILFDADGV